MNTSGKSQKWLERNRMRLGLGFPDFPVLKFPENREIYYTRFPGKNRENPGKSRESLLKPGNSFKNPGIPGFSRIREPGIETLMRTRRNVLALGPGPLSTHLGHFLGPIRTRVR